MQAISDTKDINTNDEINKTNNTINNNINNENDEMIMEYYVKK